MWTKRGYSLSEDLISCDHKETKSKLKTINKHKTIHWNQPPMKKIKVIMIIEKRKQVVNTQKQTISKNQKQQTL